MIALLAIGAAYADTPFLDTLATWTERARAELVLEDVRPSRVSIAGLDRRRAFVSAEFGTLVAERDNHGRPGVVEVVVGDSRLDSSRYQGGGRNEVGPGRRPVLFVVEDVPQALVRDLWILTDTSFKDATQRLAQKASAARQLPSPWPSDWTDAPAVRSVERAAFAPLDAAALRTIALDGSRAFREAGGLRTGWVEVVVDQAEYTLATSEGTRLVQPESWASVYAWCDAVRADGVQVYDETSWLAALPGGLPSAAEVARAAAVMASRVKARVAAPIVPEYEGPVVFEGRAAAQLFAALLSEQLEGTPPDPRPGATWEQLVRGGPRLGRRLLPQGWDVDDDPRSIPAGLPGAYTYDREGVAAEPVALVRDGVVRNLLMTRVPRRDIARSNGRARGDIQGEWRARLSGWTVTPPAAKSAKAFRRAAERAMREAGVDRVLWVRSLARGRRGALPRPQDAVWWTSAGREEPVASLVFQETSRRTLKDIVAAGGDPVTVPYLAGFGRGEGEDPNGGNPTVATVPGLVLVEDLELVFPGSDRKADAWEMPPLPPR